MDIINNIDTNYIALLKRKLLVELENLKLRNEELEKIKNIFIYDNELIEKAKRSKNKLKYNCLNLVAYSIESILSPYHKEDMDFFAEYSEEEYKGKEYIIEFLCDMAVTEETLQNENYREFWSLMKTAKSAKNAECASFVVNSLPPHESPYELEDVKLIINAKTNGIAIALKNVALSEKSIKSGYHSETMKLIFKTKSDSLASCISFFADSYQISYRKYKDFINAVAAIEIESIAHEYENLVRDFSLFKGNDYDLNGLKIIAKIKSETLDKYILDILYSFDSSLSMKERFEKVVVFVSNYCDLDSIDVSSAYNAAIAEERPSIVPKKIRID